MKTKAYKTLDEGLLIDYNFYTWSQLNWFPAPKPIYYESNIEDYSEHQALGASKTPKSIEVQLNVLSTVCLVFQISHIIDERNN